MTRNEVRQWLQSCALFVVCYLVGARWGHGRFETSMFWWSLVAGVLGATVTLHAERRRARKRLVHPRD